jgi:hypothetical protein
MSYLGWYGGGARALYSSKPTCSPGTPGIFSILETFKRHKRQTATERDKCTLLIEKPLLGIIADIHNPAVGILLMLIRSIENDLIAKKWSYFVFLCLVCLVCPLCLTCVYPICLLCQLCLLLSYSRHSETNQEIKVRHSETKYDTVRHSETKYDKVDKT